MTHDIRIRSLTKKTTNTMKTKFFFFVLLISLGFTQVKADTIHIQLPVTVAYESCENISAFNTFVIHKHPMMTGVPMWSVVIGGIAYPLGNGDSIVYVPTTTGTMSIISTWNSISFGVLLQLFSAPPSHALFTAGGATVNATNDTIWMCGSSTLVGSNTIGSEATSYLWEGPSFQNFLDDPVFLFNAGTYTFTRTNSCGVTIDTFELVELPNVLPVFHDTDFCNQAVNMTLDPGAGWSYLWSTGATTQTINVVAPGTYTVSVTNMCTSGISAITVFQNSFPEPDLSGFTTLPRCHDVVETVNPSPGFTYDSYLWSNGATTPSISVTAPSDFYSVTVTKGMCSATADASMEFFELPWTPSICIATVDLLSPHNVVRFKSIADDPAYHGTMIQFYSVYKYEITTGNKTLLSTIPDPGTETLLEYTDIASNPAVQATAYVITSTDTCGVESVSSYYNRTIKIDVDVDTQAGKVDLTIVDEYLDESGLYVPSWYYIIQDLNGVLTIIDSLAGGNHQYTVLNPVFGATYLMGIALPWACDPSKANLYETMSFSNKSPIYTGVAEEQKNQISIYPNPSSDGIFYLDGFASKIEIFDCSGQLITVFENTSIIDLSGFSSDEYICRINNLGSTKLVIMK